MHLFNGLLKFMNKSVLISVEVAFATEIKEDLILLKIQAGSKVQDAIALSGFFEKFPEESLGEYQAGIWGKKVNRSQELKDGDRVELYRELLLDPKEARRSLALKGKAMGNFKQHSKV